MGKSAILSTYLEKLEREGLAVVPHHFLRRERGATLYRAVAYALPPGVWVLCAAANHPPI